VRVPRILLPDHPLLPGPCEFEGEAVHHLGRVLRRRAGDLVILCDGAGTAFEGVIEAIDTRRCRVHLERPCDDAVESPLELRLGLALLRGERMDYALQKCCELGVTSIDLLLTDRIELRLEGKRLANRLRHFNGVLQHAVEQSGRTRLPELTPPRQLHEWTASLPEDATRLMLDPEGTPLTVVGDDAPRHVVLVSGPEGGFDDAEVAALAATGFERVRLGPRVLRAETAPVVALAVLQWLHGDFRET